MTSEPGISELPASPAEIDSAREQAIDLLGWLYADDRLELDAFSARVEQVLRARTSGEVADATTGLVAPAGDLPAFADRERLMRRLAPQLLAGEEVLWIGRPDPRRHLSAGDGLLVPFSVFWTAFALLWTVAAGSSAGNVVAPVLWGSAFVLVGLYFVAGRFVYKTRRKRRTLYAVTNWRVIALLHRRRGDSIDTAFIDALPAISKTLGRGGAGSIVFGERLHGALALYANSGIELFGSSALSRLPLAFYDVERADAVFALISRLRDGAR
ncbi:MAG: DUF1707 domain-containing protein [Solirubrobacteraceae bacterium]